MVKMPAYHFQVTALNGTSMEQNGVPEEGINEDVFDKVDTRLSPGEETYPFDPLVTDSHLSNIPV